MRVWGLAGGAAVDASAVRVSSIGPGSATGCALAPLPATDLAGTVSPGWAMFSVVCGAAGNEVTLSLPGPAGPLGVQLCTVDAPRAGALEVALLYLRAG